jgi:UDP:flavonoid glycosyltransferase YjiC (YdhE family)
MRVLFTTFPWFSHHLPMVPLEWACRTAGHEVRVASTPSLTRHVLDSGLPAVEVGRDIDLVGISNAPALSTWHVQQRWPRDWPAHPELLDEQQCALLENLAAMQFAMAEAMLDDLVEYARWWRPDIVVHNAVSYAGHVTAAAIGVPSVSHLWGTPGLQRVEMRRHGDEPLPGFVKLHERVGAPVRIHPTAWVSPCPPSMDYPAPTQTVLPMRYVPYNGTGIIPAWLPDPPGKPRILLTWGGTTATLIGAQMRGLFHQCLQAALSLDAELVVAITDSMRPLLGDLPEPARVVTSVPLHLLLPSCTAVVHHGGAGTVMTAAAAGTPQLIITRKPQNALNGTRLANTGAGIHLLYSDVPDGPDGIELTRHAINTLLEDPSYHTAAQQLRHEIAAMPTPAHTATRLEGLA